MVSWTATFSPAKTRVPLGSPVDLTYKFDVAPNAKIAGDYRVFVHFLDSDGKPLGWSDDHDHPALEWDCGSRSLRLAREAPLFRRQRDNTPLDIKARRGAGRPQLGVERAVRGDRDAGRERHVGADELRSAQDGVGDGAQDRAGTGYVQRLAVHPDARGRGLGRSLVGDVLRWMRRHGAARALVNTQRSNEAALALYRACGFRVLPEGLQVLARAL